MKRSSCWHHDDFRTPRHRQRSGVDPSGRLRRRAHLALPRISAGARRRHLRLQRGDGDPADPARALRSRRRRSRARDRGIRHPLRGAAHSGRSSGRPLRPAPTVRRRNGPVPRVGHRLRARAVHRDADRRPGVQGIGAALCTPQVLATIQATSQGAARTRAIAAFGASGVSERPSARWRAALWRRCPSAPWRDGVPSSSSLLSSPWPRSPSRRWLRVRVRTRSSRSTWSNRRLGARHPRGIRRSHVRAGLDWSWPVAVALVIAAVALVAMWKHQNAVERSGRVPLLPPSVLRLRPLQLGLMAAGLFFAGYSALLYVFPRAVEAGGLSSLDAGMALLPFAVVFAGVSLAVARIQAKLGDSTLVLGVTVQMVALVAMAVTLVLAWGSDIGLWLQPALVLLGAGQALIFSPLTQLVVREVPVEAAGLSGGMFSTHRPAARPVLRRDRHRRCRHPHRRRRPRRTARRARLRHRARGGGAGPGGGAARAGRGASV